MTIRIATHNDIDASYQLVADFFAQSLGQFGLKMDETDTKAFMEMLLVAGFAVIAEDNGNPIGVCAGFVSPMPFDRSQQVFQESIWYVSPAHRGKVGLELFSFVEAECKRRGINYLVMANMANIGQERLAEFYTKHGYRLMEQHWIKPL